jgi:hypothetical protein
MTAVEMMLSESINYERSHQLALACLLKYSSTFLSAFLGMSGQPQVFVERDSLDLKLEFESERIAFIEIKMWSTLYPQQIEKQRKIIEEKGASAFYLLLGSSHFEYSLQDLQVEVHPTAQRRSYDELIAALDAVSGEATEASEVREIATAYAGLLRMQFQAIQQGLSDPSSAHYHYLRYADLRSHIKNVKTRIYSVSHRGGPNKILNPSRLFEDVYMVKNHKTQIYFELENDKLVVKFHIETNEFDIKDKLSKLIAKGVSEEWPDLRFKKVNRHRKENQEDYPYFTACQIQSFLNEETARAAATFELMAERLPSIAKRVVDQFNS